MTNREKFIDELLATYMYSEYDNNELEIIYGIQRDEYGDVTYDTCLKWLQSESEEPEIEYMEVTNDIPRFTEIEVRNRDIDAWEKRYFLAKLGSVSCYMTTTFDAESYGIYNQARVRKDWDKCKE